MSSLPVIEPPTLEVPACCGATPATEPVTTKFHFSLNVSDLKSSVAFYEKLFGTPPAKSYDDYAKFELEQPPLVFSLVPNAPASQGALSHMGFPVSSRDDVELVARRLEQAGLPVCSQDGTVCGYARQDKIWVSDPDQNFWEVYVVHEDVDPRSVSASFDGAARRRVASTTDIPPKQIWEHRVAEGAIRKIPSPDKSLDEVRLTGTFNDSLSHSERRLILEEAHRALKPAGCLNVHGLIASQPITGAIPTLPGVAALVKRIPTLNEILSELQDVGLTGIQVTRLPAKPAFSAGGNDMHEVKVRALSPQLEAEAKGIRTVLYKGPFAQTVDDRGTVYTRGQRVQVADEQWNSLVGGSAAASFVFFGGDSPAPGPCS